MNAIDLLKAQQQQLREVLDHLAQAEEPAEQFEALEDLRDELELHHYLEENFFYPAFAKVEGFETTIKEAYAAHREVREILDEIPTHTEDWEKRLVELLSSIEQHVVAKERELFPMIRSSMSVAELEKLGETLERAREQRLKQGLRGKAAG